MGTVGAKLKGAPMSDPAVLEFLLTRRSRPAKLLTAPAPDRAELERLLTAAVRVPDHGKLEPWRLIVLGRAALDALAAAVPARGAALGLDPDQIAKMAAQYAESPLAVAVISSPVDSAKIPRIEQTLSAACVCLSLVNAALAAGWGASWLSGWAAHDRTFGEAHFGLTGDEFVAGVVHIGTAGAVPPDRPRPDLARVVDWSRA